MVTIGIDTWAIERRMQQLGIGIAEFEQKTEVDFDTLTEAPHTLTVAALARIAELFALSPGDLFRERTTFPAAVDVDLVASILAAAPVDFPTLTGMLGWPPDRVSSALSGIGWVSVPEQSERMRLKTDPHGLLYLRAVPQADPVQIAHDCPHPVEAAALLRLLHAHIASQTAHLDPADAEPLAARGLITTTPPTHTSAPGRAPTADASAAAPLVAVQPHPDLLFALGLGPGPQQQAASSGTRRRPSGSSASRAPRSRSRAGTDGEEADLK